MFYSGVGSRETPDEILGVMEDAACRLAGVGYILRSGKAGGADAAFQLGVQRYCKLLDNNNPKEYSGHLAEIYIPWKGFKAFDGLEDWWDIPLDYLNLMIPEQVEPRNKLLSEIHPNYGALLKKRGAFALHSRNIHQVVGANLLQPKPSKFCLYYAKEDSQGNPKGGTASAVNLSKRYGARTLNLLHAENRAKLEEFLRALEEKRGK